MDKSLQPNLHSSIGDLPPVEWEISYYLQQEAA